MEIALVHRQITPERGQARLARSNPELTPERSAEMRRIVETPTKGDFSDRYIRHLRMHDFSLAALQSLAPYAPHQGLSLTLKQFVEIAQRQSDVAGDQRRGKVGVRQILPDERQNPLAMGSLAARRHRRKILSHAAKHGREDQRYRVSHLFGCIGVELHADTKEFVAIRSE